MKKIPTVFERDWSGDKSRVTSKVSPGCQWVLDGEGLATRKIDGTSCRVKDGKLYKRRELRKGDKAPEDFDTSDHDHETGKTVGWVPIGEGPEDRYHREAFGKTSMSIPDGTYELIGPKVQGNPEGLAVHTLIRHGQGIAGEIDNAPRTFDELKSFFLLQDIEGIVWHHPDGRMAKIKARDFGAKRCKVVV